MRRVSIASLAVAASLAAVAAASGSGGPGWSKPITIARTGTPTYGPTAAISRNGTAVIVWEQYNAHTNAFAVVAAVRKPTGSIKTRVLGKTTGPSLQPSLALGGDGTLAVAWEQPGSKAGENFAAVRIWRPGTSFFGKTAVVSGGNVSAQHGSGDFPQVAVDGAGTVYAVWEAAYKSGSVSHYQVVETQLAKGARAWRSPVRLSSSANDAHGARIAAGGRGHATVTWSQTGGDVQARVKAASAGSFGPVQLLSSSSFTMSAPSVGVSDSGKTAAVWDGAPGRRVESKVTKGVRFPRGGQYLGGRSTGEFQAAALASNGSGVAAWLGQVGGGWSVEAAALSATSTTWSKAQRLVPTGYGALFGFVPAAAVDSQRAIVAWRQRSITKKDSIGVRVRPAGRGWQPAKVYPAVGTAVAVAVPSYPAGGGRVLGVVVWTAIKGLQLSVLQP